MYDSMSFPRRLAAAFTIAGLTTLLIVIFAFRSINSLVENEKWVIHTHQVRTDLADLLSEMKDTETGQRGFLLTNDPAYLEPYQAALKLIQASFGDVRALTADNPRQQQRLAALQPLIDAKLAELRETIDLRRTQGLDAALKVVANNSGKNSMDRIRAIVADADAEESALLRQRDQEANGAVRSTMAIILGGGLLGTSLVALLGWIITSALSRQIGTAVGRVQSSAAELQAAANQQATGSHQQASGLNEISTTISELVATARQIAESAQRVAQTAEQTASSAQTGHGTVEQTNDLITGIRRQVDLIVGHMLELGKKSQEIGAVLDIVSELAEQTNILAINATIEAAGAGEAGRRFTVVADEIRKLADRVGASTKEIRQLIDDVRSAVNTTIMATENGSKAVDAGSRQFAQVAVSFKLIADLVTTTTEAAREIEFSTKQQTSAVEQVKVAIGDIAQTSNETQVSSNQTLQTASILASLSTDLMRVIRPQQA